MILGSHEVLGLEEILNLRDDKMVKTCYSLNASAYFIQRDDFARILKAFKFDD